MARTGASHPSCPVRAGAAGISCGGGLWRAPGEHASILRVDHVMGVQRLWWIPDGASARDGAYVRYPREELLAVVAAEAAATSTTIIGEDLGTVPDEVTDALRPLGRARDVRGAVHHRT